MTTPIMGVVSLGDMTVVEHDDKLDAQDQNNHLTGGHETIVEVSGHKITVRVVRVGDIKKFHSAISPWYKECNEISRKFDSIESPNAHDISKYQNDMFDLMCQNVDNFVEACTVCTNADDRFFKRLPVEELFLVATAVVRMNLSFFVRSVAPSLMTIWKAAGMVGMTLSKPLLVQDTHTNK